MFKPFYKNFLTAKKELGKHCLRLFNKNTASRYLMRGPSCPVTCGFNGRGTLTVLR